MARDKLIYNVNPSIDVEISSRTNGTVTGGTIDMAGYGAVTFLVIGRTITDGTHSYVVQESDTTTDGDFTAVDAAQLVLPSGVTTNSIPATASTIRRASYNGIKRYVRVKLTVSGATTGGITGCMVLQSEPFDAPVANS